MFDEVPVGKCSICGGLVTVPRYSHSVVPPVPTCQQCGAVEDTAARLPTMPMKPRRDAGHKTRGPRTRHQVLLERGTVVGCCNRHADNLRCDCLAEALPSGSLAEYDALHDNGCSICRDPNCSDPGGKH